MDQSGLREERASLLWAVKASRERNTRWKASLAACNSGSLVSFRTAVLPHDGLVARAVSSTTPLGSASWLGAVEGGGAEAEVATGPMSHPTSHGCNAHTQNTSNGKGMMRKLALVVKMNEAGKLGRKRLLGRERVGGIVASAWWRGGRSFRVRPYAWAWWGAGWCATLDSRGRAWPAPSVASLHRERSIDR